MESSGDPGPLIKPSVKPLVMVVDDDPDDARVCRQTLERAGFPVVVVHDGLQVVQAVKEHEPALVVMDIRMPGMRGDHVARILPTMAELSEYAPPPVLLRSGVPQEMLDEIEERKAARACISKSASDDQLLDCVHMLIAEREAPEMTG